MTEYRTDTPGLSPERLKRMEAELIEQNRPIEAGFASLRAAAISIDADHDQLTDARMSFYAGALHCFGLLCKIETIEPVMAIDAELRRFSTEIAAQAAKEKTAH